jgi:hypothetical protein
MGGNGSDPFPHPASLVRSMTPTELRALLFLAFVAVVGAGARLVSSPERPVAEPAERRALRAQMAAVDSARERAASGRGRRVG